MIINQSQGWLLGANFCAGLCHGVVLVYAASSDGQTQDDRQHRPGRLTPPAPLHRRCHPAALQHDVVMLLVIYRELLTIFQMLLTRFRCFLDPEVLHCHVNGAFVMADVRISQFSLRVGF